MLGFHDESGISEKPTVRRTWAVKGQTPVIQSSGSWTNLSLMGTLICDCEGEKIKLFLKSRIGSVKAPNVVLYLKELKRHLWGKKLLLFWDGLPAHRAKRVQIFLEENKSKFKVVRFPAYAPELNPIEYFWAALKSKDLCNLEPQLSTIRQSVRKGYHRIKSQQNLLKGFLKASKLFSH